jgi:hypothetical protein
MNGLLKENDQGAVENQAARATLILPNIADPEERDKNCRGVSHHPLGLH